MSLSLVSPVTRADAEGVVVNRDDGVVTEVAHGACSFDSFEFRRTLGRFATGITVVTMLGDDDVPYGITVNSFMSLSLTPPLIAVSIDKRAGAHATLLQAERFGVSVLSGQQSDVSDHFAGRPVVLAGDPFGTLAGFPVIEGAIGTLVSRNTRAVDVGDHTLFIGEVEAIERRDDQPLIFFGGQYCELEH
ncbi:MAG TPA: flavin reductase family protein [Trueperaceae bacterium]|nr:flavin reductase family protein [Trueperaceae bacterium]